MGMGICCTAVVYRDESGRNGTQYRTFMAVPINYSFHRYYHQNIPSSLHAGALDPYLGKSRLVTLLLGQ
jgi:hypothetical protein